jgi:CelD/BcsL family acetyltransferase involved in cellulose biosynthesis
METTRTDHLIPLREIPHTARAAEAAARRAHPTRAAAWRAARYELEAAPGCSPMLGRHWVLTRAAADALAAEVVRLPGGSAHHEYVVREWPHCAQSASSPP